VSLVHARGVLGQISSGRVAWLSLLAVVVAYALMLTFIASTWQLGWRWSTLLVMVAAAQLSVLRLGLETPRRADRPLLPVRETPRTLVDATLPWAMASLVAVLALLAVTSADGSEAVGGRGRALGLVALCYPFAVALQSSRARDRDSGMVFLAAPAAGLVAAVAFGWTDTLAGELATAAALLALVLATLRSRPPSWMAHALRGPSVAHAGALHRPALPARARLRADLLHGFILVGLPAATLSSACWLAMGMLGLELDGGTASFILILVALLTQVLALTLWPWLPREQASQGWEAHNLLPLTSARIERAAIVHLVVMIVLFVLADTATLWLMATWLDAPLTEILDDVGLLAPLLPPMAWLVTFTWRFHKGRHHPASFAIAGVVFWFAWLMAGLSLMDGIPGALLSEGASKLTQALAMGATQLLLVALFVSVVQVLRHTWLRPERRSP
jgi:hypothetical protein